MRKTNKKKGAKNMLIFGKRKLQKLEYNMNECDSSYESQVYEELLNKACLEAAKLTFKAIQD